jgi:hypothetical protein
MQILLRRRLQGRKTIRVQMPRVVPRGRSERERKAGTRERVRADFPVRRAKRAVRFVLWSVSNANMRMNGYWEKLFFRDALKPRSNGPVFSLYHGSCEETL